MVKVLLADCKVIEKNKGSSEVFKGVDTRRLIVFGICKTSFIMDVVSKGLKVVDSNQR